MREDFYINENIIKERLKDKFYYIKVINNTSIYIDLDEVSSDYSIKGKFVAKILERLKNAEGEDREVLKLALKLGIQSLSKEEVNLNDY